MKKETFAAAWQKLLGWKGWRIAFGLPAWLLVLLSAAAGAALVWVFATGQDRSAAAIAVYVLSAYCLTAVCVELPGFIRRGKAWFACHPRLTAALRDEELSFRLQLYGEQLLNFGYGVFKIASGVVLGSAWIGCDGIYNLAQALIQLFQILRRRRPGTLQAQWRSYRVCGVLVLLLHLTLIGPVFQMVNWNRAEEQGVIMVIATAAFAFYKLISTLVELAHDRRHPHPIDSSVRMLELSQAFFAIFSLQASMFHTFGTGESWEHYMNLGTGCTVCLLTAAMGVYMIRRGTRQIRQLQER